MHERIEKEKGKRKREKSERAATFLLNASGSLLQNYQDRVALFRSFQLMNRPASRFEKLVSGHWLFKTACLSAVLPIASVAFGLFTAWVTRSVGTIAGIVLLAQIISLVLGIVGLVGGIMKKNTATIFLALFGVLAGGFFGYCAFVMFAFSHMGPH